MVYKLSSPEKAEALFAGWQETLIWSCLQKVMGTIYAEDPEHPGSAMAWIADFCFTAGKPNRELVSYWPGTTDFVIMTPADENWAALIRDVYGERAVQVTRYAFYKEPEVFDTMKLNNAVEALPDGYVLRMMDKELYESCQAQAWSCDWVSQYPDYAAYQEWGLGAVILREGEIVAGASSYTAYQGGIEIQIDTREDYRRQGLAYICGAKLILECLKRGLYPSWDAQNLYSAALAGKLGYRFSHEYTAFEVQK